MSDPIGPIRSAVAGRYEIQREIGQGAFATVYLARDLRHDRNVAFKILNADPTSETGELRFLREIRVLAKLQHPNILPLIDSGHAEAMLYYVMPYVSGETLRGRLDRIRQMPAGEAVAIAREAADAVAYAHEQGIIHRDLKPENILLSAGHAIIADFGIARAIDVAGVRQLTRTGFGSPGTPAYMSPEQLMADRAVDSRTDIYSLGCVLYEMLTGVAPFAGKDGFVRRFTEPPPPPSLKRRIPASIDAIVVTALAREPNDRYATARLLSEALAHAELTDANSGGVLPASSTGDVAPVADSSAPLRSGVPRDAGEDESWSFPVSRPRAPWRAAVVVALATLLVGGAIAWSAASRHGEETAAAPVRRLEMILPDSAPLVFVGSSYLGIGTRALAVSPDGNRLVYAARTATTTLLYARDLDKLAAVPLPGTEHAYLPFFSPDGRWVAFFADTYLKKVGFPDGRVVTLGRVNQAMGGVWTDDGRIIVADYGGTRPSTISASGGAMAPLFDHALAHPWLFPQLLPDGNWVVHTDMDGALVLSSTRTAQVYAITLTGVTRRDSTDLAQLMFGRSPIYTRTGHIVYVSSVGGTIMALPFDAAARRVLGPPVPVVEGVRQEAEAGAGQFSIAEDGTLLYVPGADAGLSILVAVDGKGMADTLPFPRAGYNGFELAPDGKQILIRILSASGRPELWVLDAEKTSQTRIRTEGIPLDIPRWWPDGKQIVFSESGGEGGFSASPIFRQRVDGGSHRDTLVAKALWAVPSPDGRHIVAAGSSGRPGLWLLPVAPEHGDPVQLVSETAYFVSFSPDSKWIVYAGTDPVEVYAHSIDRPQERHKISIEGGEEPVWSPKGDRVVYRDGERWFTVNVSTIGGFKAAKPRLLFEGPYLNVPGWSHSFYPDGKRQLMLVGPRERTSSRVIAVSNWFTELRRLAPIGTN